MDKNYHSLSELDESINEKVQAVKSLIDYLRKDEYRTFKPVRHFPLRNIFDECKINADLTYRATLTKALKEIGFLETEGRLSGMKYRLKESNFKKDSLVIAREINEFMNNNRRYQKKSRINHPKLAQVSKIVNRDFSSKPAVIKKEYSLGESVYLLKDNNVSSTKDLRKIFELRTIRYCLHFTSHTFSLIL